MKPLLRVLSYVDKFNEYVAKISSWLIFPVLFIMSYEVIRRKGFNNPTIWSHEMSYFLCSCMLMFGMAYVLRVKGHITIDILYEKFPPRVRAALDVLFFFVFFVPLWYIGLKLMVFYLSESYRMQERDYWGCWFPLLWPLKTWTLIGSIMFAVQGIAEFIKDAVVLVKGCERP